MVEDLELAVLAEQVRQALPQGALPHRFAPGLGHKERHLQAVMHDQAFDQHQADIGLAEADTIAKKGTSIAIGPLQQGVVALALIRREDLVDRGVIALPLGGGQFVALEELKQGLRVDIEGCVVLNVALDDLQHIRGHVFGVVPVLVEPLLQDRNLAAGDLDIQLDVLSQAGVREVG